MTAAQLAKDPEQILNDLPEREREGFLQQYRAAAHKAADDPAAYQELQRLLHGWTLKAVAVNKPGYYERREQARKGEGEWISLEEIVERRRAGGW